MHWLQNIHRWIILFLFPPKQDIASLLQLSLSELLSTLPKATHLKNYTALLSYKDPKVRLLIATLKYRGDKEIARMFAHMLCEHIAALAEDQSAFTEHIYLIPIPRSPKRRKELGFCQTELIAQEIKTLLPYISIYTDVLKKKDVPPQTSLSRTKRAQNVKDAFYLTHTQKIRDKHIILLDDVITTGATLTEARRVIRDSGGRVVECLAVAH